MALHMYKHNSMHHVCICVRLSVFVYYDYECALEIRIEMRQNTWYASQNNSRNHQVYYSPSHSRTFASSYARFCIFRSPECV